MGSARANARVRRRDLTLHQMAARVSSSFDDALAFQRLDAAPLTLGVPRSHPWVRISGSVRVGWGFASAGVENGGDAEGSFGLGCMAAGRSWNAAEARAEARMVFRPLPAGKRTILDLADSVAGVTVMFAGGPIRPV